MRKSSFRSYQFKLKVSHRDPTLHLWIVQPPKRVVLIQKQKFIKSFRVQSGTWSYTLYMLPHTQTAKVEVCLGNPYFCIHHSWQKEVRTYTDTAFVYFFFLFYCIYYLRYIWLSFSRMRAIISTSRKRCTPKNISIHMGSRHRNFKEIV